MSSETVSRTLLVALLLCVVCSVIVSTAAVVLRPIQAENKALDKQKNILAAAAMLPEDPTKAAVSQVFERNIVAKVVDLDSGRFVENLDGFNARKAAKDPKQSRLLTKSEDIASIKRRANYAEVYLVVGEDRKTKNIILPVHGYGLWSTMYGFLALDNDANTVLGLGFYEHAETPGLGGEIDNPRWKALWPGKKIYAQDGSTVISLVKGGVASGAAKAQYKVDALSGATITSRGVENALRFWMGPLGYKVFLDRYFSGQRSYTALSNLN